MMHAMSTSARGDRSARHLQSRISKKDSKMSICQIADSKLDVLIATLREEDQEKLRTKVDKYKKRYYL